MLDMEVCAECQRPIQDQYVLRVGESSLHQDCLKCACCRTLLTDSCFSKFGQFYCRADFYRMFGPRCTACHLVFNETDRARKIGDSLFHTHCFSCRDCSAPLTEGDKVGCDHRGNLYCEIDYIKHKNSGLGGAAGPPHGGGGSGGAGSGSSSSGSSSASSSSSNLLMDDMMGSEGRGMMMMGSGVVVGGGAGGVGHLGGSHDDLSGQYLDLDGNGNSRSSTGGDEIKRETTPRSPDTSINNSDNEDDSKLGDGEIGKDGKRRGPRTTIKAKQLEILKTCFDQNPKPTRQVREQLAKETGLPMRVIQVWFQNKRSKQKRINQMQFLTGSRFPPHHHMGMPFPPHPWGPPPPHCFPPGSGGGDYPPPPPHHMFPPAHHFDPAFGPPPPHHPDYPPFPPYRGGGGGPDFPDQNGRSSESPTGGHCYPSPPTQPSDFNGLDGANGYPPPPPGTDPCYPSPPLDFSSCPPPPGNGGPPPSAADFPPANDPDGLVGCLNGSVADAGSVAVKQELPAQS